jgi:hypothetical protein
MNDRLTWTDSELDGLLSRYLTEGPETPPDRIVENAMRQVATTRQEGTAVLRLWAWASSSPAVAAAVVVALVLGLGLILVPALVGDRNPQPGPSGPPPPATEAPLVTSPSPSEFVTFSSADDGYEILIPSGWDEVPSEYPDARTWAGEDGELMISYGTSIFDGGEVTVCAPPLPDYVTCGTDEYGYSIPYDPEVDGVGPISMEVWLDRCDGGCPVAMSEVVLDGEAAEMDRAVISDRQLTYVGTFHDRRPIILYWSEPIELADVERIEEMLASFRFLEAASPAPFVDPTELVRFGGQELGYEVLLPRVWVESADSPAAGVTTFGSGRGAATRGSPALTISLGDRDGSITVCQARCEQVEATTLEEIEAVLVSVMEAPDPEPPGFPRLVHGDVSLGGEPGRFERPDYLRRGDPEDADLRPRMSGGNCLGCPDMRYQLYVLHDGRPLLLTFDFWTVAFEAISFDYFRQIIESFRFLD